MLVQVVKEEARHQGCGAHDLSFARRPLLRADAQHPPRGGGISRKITNVQDRKRLKEIAGDLEVPEGMGVILRNRRRRTHQARDQARLRVPAARLGETCATSPLRSTAPTLVYEEGSLVKRSIREPLQQGHRRGDRRRRRRLSPDARDFMRMLMPSHAKKREALPREPAGASRAYGHRGPKLDGMFPRRWCSCAPAATSCSTRTEALVGDRRPTPVAPPASTTSRIPPSRTNLEASEEGFPPASAARPRRADRHRLHRHGPRSATNRSVERRLKECLKNDRARHPGSAASRISACSRCRGSVSAPACWRARPTSARIAAATGHVRLGLLKSPCNACA